MLTGGGGVKFADVTCERSLSKKFLLAITPLYQKQIKSRFRGNLDEDPPLNNVRGF